MWRAENRCPALSDGSHFGVIDQADDIPHAEASMPGRVHGSIPGAAAAVDGPCSCAGWRPGRAVPAPAKAGVAPGSARAVDRQDVIRDAAMIVVGAALARALRGPQGRQTRPRPIRQLITLHAL